MNQPIIDAHHHLWDLDKVQYPWLMAKGVKRFFGDPEAIQKNYLVSDFRDDIGELSIDKSVHIQVGAADQEEHLAEARWLQAQHVQFGLPSAMVAFCDLSAENLDEWLDQLQQYSCLRGIRQIVGRSPEEDAVTGTDDLIGSAAFIQGLGELERRGLSFDLQLIPDQMQRVADVLENFKELKVVLCHAGSPWYRDQVGYKMWQQGLKRLAARPNTFCKVSGLSMFDHDWTVDSLQPIVSEVIETFTTDRVMMGSNFPVDKLHTDYQRLWSAYTEITKNYNEKARADMFYNNAAAFYNI